MAEVTDPDLLKKLEAGAGKPVTDPKILEKLEGGAPAKKGGSGLWNSAMDFFKSIPTGLAEATRTPGAFGTQGALEAPDEGLDKARAGAQSQLHQPQGFPGRVGAAAGAAATNPLTFAPMGSLAKTAAGAAGSIVGGQAGEDIGGPVGGFIGGAAGGAGAARMVGKPPITTPRTSVTKPVESNNPTVEAAAKTMRSFGVEPSAGNLSGSKLLADTEQMGGAKSVQTAEKQLTAAGANLMGVRADNLAPGVLKENMDRLKGNFERSLRPLSIVLDDKNTLLDELTQLRADMVRRAEPAAQGKLDALIADAGLGWNELEETGSRARRGGRVGEAAEETPPYRARWQENAQGQFELRGPDYHNFVKTGSNLDAAIHSGNPDVAKYAYQLRQILDNALEKSSQQPLQQQALALFKKTKEEYFTQKVVNEAIVREAKDGNRRGLIDAKKLYDRLQTYGWDGGVPRTQLEKLASGAVSTVSRTKDKTLGAGHEAGTARSIASHVGGTLGGLVGGAAGLPFGLPAAAGGAAAGYKLGSAAGPYAAGKIANTQKVQNYFKKQREITAAARAKAEASKAPVSQAAVRGIVGGTSAREKRKRAGAIYQE